MGGLLMFTGGVLEWVLGNTFASVVFCTFGGFYFSYGATLLPSFNTSAAYAPADGPASAGAATQGFNASLAFVFLFMGVLCFIFLVCSLRTNVVFVVIFLSLMLAFFLLTGGYMALASDFTGNADKAGKLIIVSSTMAWRRFVLGVDTNSRFTGWRSKCFRVCHDWLVPVDGSDAGRC
jgi:succinate-acetate transporter protein